MRRRASFIFGISLALLAHTFVPATFAAVPTLDHVFPAGGQIGSTFNVTTTGKLEPWPAKVWIDCAGVEFKPSTNSGQYTVTVAKDAPLGPHVVRAFNADGASEPRTFVIGRHAEITEQEPNDNFAKAQRVSSLPVVINGKLEKRGDVDSFAVRVEAGRWLVAAVDGYSLGSPMDPFLHVLDERGVKLVYSADTHNLDPFIAFRVERTGTYIVQVAAFAYPPAADVQLAGSAACIYRLTLSDAPFAHHTFPAGVKRGSNSTVELGGWNLPTKSSCVVDTPAASALMEKLFVTPPESDRPIAVLLGDSPELVEIEPNNTATNAQPVALPFSHCEANIAFTLATVESPRSTVARRPEAPHASFIPASHAFFKYSRTRKASSGAGPPFV
ncbi:MAG: PPC domain-containing protein [Verrucomicrobia bacterium]|nr:PPC domain-containing protein [Verrucomicrobiota bacterium]